MWALAVQDGIVDRVWAFLGSYCKYISLGKLQGIITDNFTLTEMLRDGLHNSKYFISTSNSLMQPFDNANHFYKEVWEILVFNRM